MSGILNLTQSEYKNHKAVNFTVGEASCTLIFPDDGKKNGRWVWRAEFLGAFDSVDMALLEKGWCIAYCGLSDMFGCPEAVRRMKVFHDIVVSEFALNQKADIFGFSRGGLYSFNYTIKYPEDISVLYLDAAVLDIKSWPLSSNIASKSPHDAEMCMKWYGLTEETKDSFKDSPVDHIDDLIQTKVPILMVAGGADEAVPYEENGLILENRMNAENYDCLVIVKPDCGHHPHSLENPAPAVEFIESHS